jgi:hypothetical protein
MKGRKGISAGSSSQKAEPKKLSRLAAPKPKEVELLTPEAVETSEPTFARIKEAVVSLAGQIKGAGKKKSDSAGKLTGTVNLMKDSTKEYMYLVNGHVHRAINESTNGIIRNGYTITPEKASDQKAIDQLMENVSFDTLLHDFVLDAYVYGASYLEPFDGPDGLCLAEIPPAEMDFQRDSENNIMYDKDGFLVGYVQTRGSEEVAKWDANEIGMLKFLSLGGSDVGISSIQAAVHPATQAGLIRSTSAEAFSRSLNVMHVSIDGASADDILLVSDELSQNFTSESAYVTSERYNIKSLGNATSSINVASYLEPNIAEIAAAYSMPIELVSATATFRIDDFEPRYNEWLQSLKVKQKIVADVFEKQIFPTFCEGKVTMKFNDPEPLSKSTLLNNIGFATQSDVFTPEIAKNALIQSEVFPSEIFEE